MSKTVIATASAPAAIGPYSQAIKSGAHIFCSGQLGIDPATGELAVGVRAQAERSLLNMKAIAEAAGATLDSVVKTTIFLADMADFAVVNEVYGSFFKGEKPARSTIAVAGLPKGGLVEIEAILAL
ncbi:MAG: reactive intermediate/imine deaminase [Spirochaetae bacterium HGW-Spirochaetae-3]|jgi:2-iminobutanoate/2-iminopropanoate deaminase|nr:MAG: reactive intermediate/imine deaminase [Spirochaetae bacterium HGW-Spirochaetae-3]